MRSSSGRATRSATRSLARTTNPFELARGLLDGDEPKAKLSMVVGSGTSWSLLAAIHFVLSFGSLVMRRLPGPCESDRAPPPVITPTAPGAAAKPTVRSAVALGRCCNRWEVSEALITCTLIRAMRARLRPMANAVTTTGLGVTWSFASAVHVSDEPKEAVSRLPGHGGCSHQVRAPPPTSAYSLGSVAWAETRPLAPTFVASATKTFSGLTSAAMQLAVRVAPGLGRL